ncbi:MAG: Maf family protein [Candidatus Zixiibacteriota bacterium]
MFNRIKELARRRKLVLASRSPRRVALLKELGISFEQIVPTLVEHRQSGEPPFEFARRLARDKAVAVARQCNENHVVIGCDTVVVLDNQVLQKPMDKEDAFAILSRLAGKQHVVCTALALAGGSKVIADGFELTDVFFNPAPPQQIRKYIETGEPTDKAGAYGIQGMGAFLVDRIKGNLDNVIGLPRTLLDGLADRVLTAMPE